MNKVSNIRRAYAKIVRLDWLTFRGKEDLEMCLEGGSSVGAPAEVQGVGQHQQQDHHQQDQQRGLGWMQGGYDDHERWGVRLTRKTEVTVIRSFEDAYMIPRNGSH